MTDLLTRFVKWLIAPALRLWCEESGVVALGCPRSEYAQRRIEEMAAAGASEFSAASLQSRVMPLSETSPQTAEHLHPQEPSMASAHPAPTSAAEPTEQELIRAQVVELVRSMQQQFLQDLRRAGVRVGGGPL